MKVRIDKPCFIESEAPFTIIPIYQAKAEVAEQPAPAPVHKHDKRKSPKRSRRTCIWCGEGFLGRGPAMFCSTPHKQAAYRRYGNADGVRKALAKGLAPLHIHAGASGVEVTVNDQ